MPTLEISTLDPADQRRLLAAEGYLALEMIPEAEAELVSLSSDARSLPAARAVRMMLCQRAGEWQAMLDVACSLAANQPGESQWWISWAYAARRAESLPKALEVLVQARRLHARDAIVQFNLACYLAQLGRLDEARENLREAIRLDRNCRRMAREEPDLAPLRGGG